MNERAACRGTLDDLTAAWCIDPPVGGRRSFGNDRGVSDDTGGDGYDVEERRRAVAVVREREDGEGCCSDDNPIDDAARVDGSDNGMTKMMMSFVRACVRACVCVCVCVRGCMLWEVKVVLMFKDKRTMMWRMMMVNMNPWYVCVFQEVTLSSQPSVGRLILAVLRDITGWLIAVATSLQSQSSAATMWPRQGRWVGVGHTRARWQQHTWTHQAHTEVW